MSSIEQVPIVIVGGGPAAYTAAIYAARAALRPVCVEGYLSGGQIVRSGEVHNYPGFPEGIAGHELADRMRQQAIGCGARVVTDDVAAVDLGGPPFTVETLERTFRAEAVILATGASPRRLGLPSEDEFDGRGVCYCAICDGPLFAGRPVVVVGGGDAAVDEALALSRIASHVTLVHRRTELRAGAASRAALAGSLVTLLTPYVVEEIVGGEAGVTGVRVREVAAGGGTRLLEADGCFVAIGHEPASGLFGDHLEVDARGFVRTAPGDTATSVPGVFAAGEVAESRYRQAITAAASGCAAALDAERWLLGHRPAAAAAEQAAHAAPSHLV